ncbi:hypothetical protein ACE6H2_016002 [Prunus campanulata]
MEGHIGSFFSVFFSSYSNSPIKISTLFDDMFDSSSVDSPSCTEIRSGFVANVYIGRSLVSFMVDAVSYKLPIGRLMKCL